MALTNYSELKAAVATWLNRTDLTDQIPDFITLAESRLNRDLELRRTEVETTLSVADQASTVAIPSDFVSPVGLWVSETDGRRLLRYLDPVQMPEVATSGDIYEFTITEQNIVLERPSQGAISLIFRYRQAFALSDASPTNWLLTTHPDAYLFGALVEVGPYLRDNDLLAIYSARYQAAIDAINEKEARVKAQATLTPDLPLMPSYYQRRFGAYAYGGY
jgi:hypothetical protein